MPKRWLICTHDARRIADLSHAAGIPPVVAHLLINRGIVEPSAVQAFLQPRLADLREPDGLPGATKAAEVLWSAVQHRLPIVVYADYDVDGIAGGSTLYLALKLLGANVSYYIPHRLEEGYGLGTESLKTLAAQGAKLVVTVDCGIASVEEALTARALGLRLVITDHHEFGPALPEAEAIVHPRLPGADDGNSPLSGAGVAFKVAWALCQLASGGKKVTPPLREFLMQSVVMAALGAVADVVPLLGENRILVRYGLAGLKETTNLGLQALLRVAGLADKRQLSSTDIGFALAPRLNAAGRLGQARLAFELLTTTSESRAADLAVYLDQLNENRKSLERSIYLAANKQAQEQFDPENDAALVLAERGWHAGVIGIVAGKLAEKYHRPVVMISLDEFGRRPALGSARGVPGFRLHEALAACGHHLLGYGGHAAAAGLRIDERHVESFRAEFREYAAAEIPEEQRLAELAIDAETMLAALNLNTVEQIEQLAPFGAGNSRPLLCASGLQLEGPVKKIGAGERHLSLRLRQHQSALRAVAFGAAEWADALQQHAASLDVAFRPTINDFNGMRRVEMEVVDWKPAAQPSGPAVATRAETV